MDAGALLSTLAPDDSGWALASQPQLDAYAKRSLSDETQAALSRGGAAVTAGKDASGRMLRLCWFGGVPGLALHYVVLGGQLAPDQSA
jgi:hypothetical protein